MVPSITTILQRFTGEWAALLQPDAILAVCREIGYAGWRDRVLTPVTTVQLFLLQILHGNTACRHLPHLSGLRFSAAAYCQARGKLPLHLFIRLLERFGRAVQPSALEDGRWHGHRTFLVDGSGCSMPDTPALQEAFGQAPERTEAVALAQDFASLVRQRQPAQLEPWLARAAHSALPPFRRFAKGLRADLAAVQAAVTWPWSQGPIEGQINRF